MAGRTKEGGAKTLTTKVSGTIHVCPRKADNNPDYVDLVEFLKTFKHDPMANQVGEPVKLAP
jgi:hypothetical protein